MEENEIMFMEACEGVQTEAFEDTKTLELESVQLEDDESLQAEDQTEEGEKASANHNKTLGQRGEEAAARYLEHRGYEILERNWVCPAGEADIIAFDCDELVFVEVKTRSNIDMGFPEEAITPEKRARYERIAAYYLRDVDYEDMNFRFDVIGLLVLNSRRAAIRHHINAFGSDSL